MSDNYPSSAWLPDDAPSEEVFGDLAEAAAIFRRYHRHYDGEVQGCCLVIADEIQRMIGGEIVAGYIEIYGGTSRRSHWWVEKNGERIDPMGAAAFSEKDYPVWVEAHRDRALFETILPRYEQWRVI